MKPLLYALAGAATGALYVLVAGFFEIRIDAARYGVALDVNNNVAEVAGPRVAVEYIVALAVVGAGVVAALMVAVIRAASAASTAFAAGLAVASLAGVVLSYVAFPYEPVLGGGDGEPFGSGWTGWIEYGGRSSAVQVVAAVAVIAPLLTRVRIRKAPGKVS